MVKRRASRKFIVKSLNAPKVSQVVVKNLKKVKHAIYVTYITLYVNYIVLHFITFWKIEILASESDFWWFWDPKIHWGPALRAMFRILAEPRVVVIVALAHEW